jgi:hypothetical protein
MRSVRVSGPVSGAQPPYGSPLRLPAEAGYVCEEFLIEGSTMAYLHAEGRPDPHGHWLIDEYGEGDFRTRILVVRPLDPTRFNGTVLLHWLNVSAGREIERPDSDELYRGYAWVGVSAQETGLYGPMSGGRKPGLIEADPERYSTLFHPGDQGSFDIFTQTARAVGAGRAPAEGEPDPLGGLEVRRVIATGGSQSAMRLVAYANSVHSFEHALDGFLLTVWEGRAPLLNDGAIALGTKTELRDDLDVPALIVNSEFEAGLGAAVHMPDSERLRVWEVAGTGHGHWRRPKVPMSERGWGPNPVTWKPVEDAATRALHDWVRTGTPAPAQLRITRLPNDPERIARDERGNALGGIRLPEIAAPIAEYRGTSFKTGVLALYGGYRPFPPEVLTTLYATQESYRRAWTAAVDELLGNGTLLAEEADAVRQRGLDVAESLPLG